MLPPWFDGARHEVGNLGALGSVVGHEFTHGFDASGRLHDAQGTLRDWWTEATGAAFEERAQCLVEQYSRFEVLPGRTVNGELTLAENIADAGGLLLAHDVLVARAPGAPSRAGYDAEQQFFIAHAQLECENRRPESALTELEWALVDGHALRRNRHSLRRHRRQAERAFEGVERHIEATDLPEDIARTAEAQVAAGRLASVEDVVRAGVEAIATLEQKRAAVTTQRQGCQGHRC